MHRQAECQHCAELREEIAYLKSELGLVLAAERVAALRRAYGLTESEATLVLRLYEAKGRCVSRPAIVDALPHRSGYDGCGDNLASVFVAKARAKLPDGTIETVRGMGFSMPAAARERIAALFATDPSRAAA